MQKATHARALGLAAAVVIVAVGLSCAPRRTAPPLPGETTGGFANEGVPTAEEVIRQHDMMRLRDLQDAQNDMDERFRTLEESEDPGETGAVEEPKSSGRMRGFLEKAGIATYVVLVVAFNLGMAALPFLI